MTKRKNPFIRTKQFYYTDGLDINWWIDEEDLKWFKKEFDDCEAVLKDERTLNGKEYNEWMIGNVFGDFEGVYIDEDCPKCEHLLVNPECHPISDYKPTNQEKFCSNFECEYTNEEFQKYRESEDIYWENFRSNDRLPTPKFREVGQTVEEFAEKYGFSRLKKEVDCVVCGRTIPIADFFLMSGYAVVSYEHDDCSNGGPSVAIPQGEEAKKWAEIL